MELPGLLKISSLLISIFAADNKETDSEGVGFRA